MKNGQKGTEDQKWAQRDQQWTQTVEKNTKICHKMTILKCLFCTWVFLLLLYNSTWLYFREKYCSFYFTAFTTPQISLLLHIASITANVFVSMVGCVTLGSRPPSAFSGSLWWWCPSCMWGLRSARTLQRCWRSTTSLSLRTTTTTTEGVWGQKPC